MARKPLRAVPEGERQAAKPKTVKEAADASERDLLVSLRTLLATELDKGAVPPHALASVTGKVREYDRDIRALDAREDQEGGEGGATEDETWTAV